MMEKNLVEGKSVDFMADRAFMQQFAASVDPVFDRQGRSCGISVDHRFMRAIAGINEYVIDCIAPTVENFIEFEKKHLDPFCNKFKDVMCSVDSRQLRDRLHRVYSFSKKPWVESVLVIDEDTKVPGTDIILEKGDKILYESVYSRTFTTINDLKHNSMVDYIDDAISDVVGKDFFTTQVNDFTYNVKVNCNPAYFDKIDVAIERLPFFKAWK